MAVPTYKSKYTGEEVDARLDLVDSLDSKNTQIIDSLKSKPNRIYYLSDSSQTFTSSLPSALHSYPLEVSSNPASFVVSMSPAFLVHAQDRYVLRLRLSSLNTESSYRFQVLLEDILSFDQSTLISDVAYDYTASSAIGYIDIKLPVTSPSGLDYMTVGNALRLTLRVTLLSGTSHSINIVTADDIASCFLVNPVDAIDNTLLIYSSSGIETQAQRNKATAAAIETINQDIEDLTEEVAANKLVWGTL